MITVKSKYYNYYFWENIVNQDKYNNPFADDIISKESVFFHGVIVNCYAGSYERWIHFPNIKALIGYLNYIFVPTAFFTFLSAENEITILQSKVDGLLDLMNESDKCRDKELIPQMRESSIILKESLNYNDNKCIDEIKKFSVYYNTKWNHKLDKFSYFEVYETPIELGHYIVDAYENSEHVDIPVLERQLGVSKEERLSICSQVYENKFMQRKFTEILNNRISDML